jgi:L-ascorbate metabolism protein UlaG (beta-lactamase superfamily)
MKIDVNTQSSIKITGDKVIYIDPYKIDEESHDADFIFVTHDHYDHFDVKSINNIKKDSTFLIVPDSIITSVFSIGFDMKNVRGVVPKEQYTIEGLTFKTVSSYNMDKPFHPQSKKYVGYIIDLEETIYIAGDTDYIDELKEIECDIACVPIGGTYTMDYKEAAELINTINPKKVYPTHYGSIVGDISLGNKFKELLKDNIECIIVLD